MKIFCILKAGKSSFFLFVWIKFFIIIMLRIIIASTFQFLVNLSSQRSWDENCERKNKCSGGLVQYHVIGSMHSGFYCPDMALKAIFPKEKANLDLFDLLVFCDASLNLRTFCLLNIFSFTRMNFLHTLLLFEIMRETFPVFFKLLRVNAIGCDALSVSVCVLNTSELF